VNLRQSLKNDFGIEVFVEGGRGLRDDPFVIERCSAADATRTQLDLLRGLERGRGELWRLLRAEPALDVAPTIQRLQIESVLFTQDKIITETRAHYFDVGKVDGVPNASAPLVEWSDPRTTFAAIYQIGWLHFDRAINNSQSKDAIDTTLQYSSIGAKAGIYIYDYDRSMQELPLAERRAKELRTACDQVLAIHPNAQAPWPIGMVEPFAIQTFLSGEHMSVAAVAVLGRHFLKLRLTFMDERKMRELMNETFHELARFAQMSEFGASVSNHVRH
jgi:hypothetical protein